MAHDVAREAAFVRRWWWSSVHTNIKTHNTIAKNTTVQQNAQTPIRGNSRQKPQTPKKSNESASMWITWVQNSRKHTHIYIWTHKHTCPMKQRTNVGCTEKLKRNEQRLNKKKKKQQHNKQTKPKQRGRDGLRQYVAKVVARIFFSRRKIIKRFHRKTTLKKQRYTYISFAILFRRLFARFLICFFFFTSAGQEWKTKVAL